MTKRLAVLCLISILSAPSWATELTEQLVGRWSGVAHFNQETTRLTLIFKQQANQLTTRLSLLDIGVSGWPALSTKVTGKKVEVVLPSDSGPQHINLTINDGQLTGSWQEQRYPSPALVTLAKETGPAPLQEQRVQLNGSAGKLGASLILPKGKGPFPAIVFIHGSGGQPRDASRFIAEQFATLGIASLIYDKRGVGESAGHFQGANFTDLTDDAITMANYLRSLNTISHVGFWGHSQGGWLAPLAALRWQHSAFAISSAGPAVSPAREGEWGFISPILALPESQQIIPKIRALVAAWHDGLRKNDWDSFDRLARHHQQEDWFAKTGLTGLVSRPSADFSGAYKAFMDYQPLPTLAQLKVPMLAIYALDDESIDSRESIQIMEELIEQGQDIQLKVYTGVDHAMRHKAVDGQPLRFPNHPTDYIQTQAEFIAGIVKN